MKKRQGTETNITQYSTLLGDLVALFNLILLHETGLAILLGELPAPSSLDLYYMKTCARADLGVRIKGGENVPFAESVINVTHRENSVLRALGIMSGAGPRDATAGGWKRINEAFRAFRAAMPETWALFEYHVLFIVPGGLERDGQGGMSKKLSRRYDNVVPRTLRRRRNIYTRKIAAYVLSWHQGEDFRLKG